MARFYRVDGTFQFEEYSQNGSLHGESKYFHENGTLGIIKKFSKDYNVDITYIYDTSGLSVSKIQYPEPCLRTSSDCNQLVTIFAKGQIVYTYKVLSGWRQQEHNVINKPLYDSLAMIDSLIPELTSGLTIYTKYCPSCHLMCESLLGGPIEEVIDQIPQSEMYPFLINESVVVIDENSSMNHPSLKISKNEFGNLMNYIKSRKNIEELKLFIKS